MRICYREINFRPDSLALLARVKQLDTEIGHVAFALNIINPLEVKNDDE